MFQTVFALFIFTGHAVTADLQFATKEHCEEVRTQIQLPRVAYKTQCVEMKVPVKKLSLDCDFDVTDWWNSSNSYVHHFPAPRKLRCKETR